MGFKMKLILLILVMNVVIEGESSCNLDNETLQLFTNKNYYYENYEKQRPLYSFISHLRRRKKLKNIVDLKFPKLHCDIENICTNTTVYKTEKKTNERSRFSFCELYFEIEHKKQYVFTIDYFKLWLYSRQNFSIHSNQIVKMSENPFFNTR